MKLKNKSDKPKRRRRYFRPLTYLTLFIAVAFVNFFNVQLLYFLDQTDEVAVIYKIMIVLFSMAVSSFALYIGYLHIDKKYVIKPVQKIEDAARRVAAGDFTVRIDTDDLDRERTQFIELIDDFNAMTGELAATEIMKTDFISNVSHELKTPISVISNYASLLRDESLSEDERREYAAVIADASSRLSVMVTNILRLSRLENQKITVNRRRFNLSEELSRCALGFEDKWDEKNIALDIDLDDSIYIDSDEDLLDIVWNNLLSNAVKFTPESGTVGIKAVRSGRGIMVSVSDSGIGMTEDDIKHIFDKFYQADKSHASQGNGLGLALVKKITELLGGDVAVTSRPGEGSIFSVTLPDD